MFESRKPKYCDVAFVKTEMTEFQEFDLEDGPLGTEATGGFSDKYEVKEKLGAGFSSVVRQCFHKATGKPYAVKIIDKLSDAGGVDIEETTRDEVTILLALQGHDNIIGLVDVFESPVFFFLVFELAAKGELFDDQVTLSEKKTRPIMLEVFEAVKFMHENNIVHRDLKPENILLDEDFRVKIADFGFAVKLREGEKLRELCGTPDYLSPEVLQCSFFADAPGYGKEVDMWACGVIMYTLLVGCPPFWHRRQIIMVRSIMEGRYHFHSPEWDDISESAKDLISKLLVVNPKLRLTAEQALEHPWFKRAQHSARPVKTERDLPFGVRTLNAFLTLQSEYLNLYDALAESAYRQTSSSETSGTFPDLYVRSSSAGNRDSSSRQNDASDEKNLNDNLPQVSSDVSHGISGEGLSSNSTENSAKDGGSVTPLNTAEGAKIQEEKYHTDGDSNVVDQKEPRSEKQSKTESNTLLDAKPGSVEHTDEQDVNGDRTTEGGSDRIVNEVEEQTGSEICGLAKKRAERAQEESKDLNRDSIINEIEVTNSTAAFDSSSCESGLSNDVSLAMEAIGVAGLKVIECSTPRCQGQQSDKEKDEIEPSKSCTGSSCNGLNCKTSESPGNDDADICSLEDLIW